MKAALDHFMDQSVEGVVVTLRDEEIDEVAAAVSRCR